MKAEPKIEDKFTADFAEDLIAGLREISDKEKSGEIAGDASGTLSVCSILLKHIGPYVKGVKLTGSRRIRVAGTGARKNIKGGRNAV